ncbi:MAG: hypothetical protein V1837_06315 [Candidatus Woesearchaeota archaeon]
MGKIRTALGVSALSAFLLTCAPQPPVQREATIEQRVKDELNLSDYLQKELDTVKKGQAALYFGANWCKSCKEFGPTIKESARLLGIDLLVADYSELPRIFEPYSATLKKNGIDPAKVVFPAILIRTKMKGYELYIGGGFEDSDPYMVASDGRHTPLREIFGRVSKSRPSGR